MLINKSNFHKTISLLNESNNPVAVDTETRGLNPYTGGYLCGISVYLPGQAEAWYYSFRHADHNLPTEYIHVLKNAIANKKIIGFNYKFDAKMLEREGWQFPSDLEDVDLAFRIFDENSKKNGLKDLADKHLSNDSSKEREGLKALLKTKKLKMGDMNFLTGEEVDAYASQDAVLTWKLREFIMPHLEKWSLVEYWHELNKMSMIMAELESTGIQLDRHKIEVFSAECLSKMSEIQVQINKIVGYEINLNSPKQLKEWLKVESTAAAKLDELVTDNPNIKLLQEYRSCAKSNSTYYEAFKEGMDSAGRLHCTYRVAGTVTGRMSCTEPNLQAIPRSADKATDANAAKLKVKTVFMAKPGYKLIEADYSQLELRLAAHFCKEDNWVKAYTEGIDLHQLTADSMGISRTMGKTLNFSVLYGAGRKRIQDVFKVPENQAANIVANYWKSNPKLKHFADKIRDKAKTQRYLRLFTGRIRRFQYIYDEDTGRMMDTSWDALNSLIQGTGAETTRLAIMKIHKKLKTDELDARLVLTVHDSIVVEAANSCAEQVAEIVKTLMEDNPWCSIKLQADIKVREVLG